MPDFEPVIREKPIGATDLTDVEIERLKARHERLQEGLCC